MLTITDEAKANQSRAWEQERLKLLAIISLDMGRRGLTQADYTTYELDNARSVIVTQDEHGNVKVAKDS